MHVRYNRSSFPQDLQFQVTPNPENFQARYIITHPATGDLGCEAGKRYVKDLKERRQMEMETLEYLTGKTYSDWDMAVNEEDVAPAAASYESVAYEKRMMGEKQPLMPIAFGAGALLLFGLYRRGKK